MRLSHPEVSLALSGREEARLRDRFFRVVDYIGSGGTPNPGGRTCYREDYEHGDTQFKLYETRTPRKVIAHLKARGIEVKREVSWGKA